MKNYNELKAVQEELRKNHEAKETITNNYNNMIITCEQFLKAYEINQQEDLRLTFKQNIIKNNLFLEVHNKLLEIYKEVFQKYENKNIGEKRKEEIRGIFKNQLKDVINFEEKEYYSRFWLSFTFEIKYCNDKVFTISIEKIKYDFSYYVDNKGDLKALYNYEFPKYIENVEEEAKRLVSLYNEAIEKQEKYKKELDEYSNYIYSNFPKNLYNDDISRLRRTLSLNW